MDKQDKIGVGLITALCIAILLGIISTIMSLMGLMGE